MVTDEAAYVDLLVGAGFRDVDVRTIGWEHDFRSPDVLWDGLLASSVRTAALVTEQPPETQATIRACYDEIVAAYQRGDRLDLPVSVLLISGRKP